MLPSLNDTNKGILYGHTTSDWKSVRSVFEQNFIDQLDIGASLCIYHRGKCVVDLCGGWKLPEEKKETYTPDTLQLVFSVSKGILAAAIALCVERNWLDYDRPVAQYWPEFAANGKQNITVGQLMAHRAGISYIDEELTSEDVYNWSGMTSLTAAQKPSWEPGTAHGYHAYTLGYAAGELIHRVDPHHRTYGQFVRDEIDKEFYVGLPDDELQTRMSHFIRKKVDVSGVRPTDSHTDKALSCSGAFPFEKLEILYNDIRFYRAQIPAVNGITNARTLARIYALLIGDINENGKKCKRLLSDKTLNDATENITPINEPDRNLYNMLSVYAKGGFQIYHEYFKIFGDGVFGHTGFGGSVAFAYPQEQIAYAYVCNQLDPTAVTIDQRTVRILQAIETILQS